MLTVRRCGMTIIPNCMREYDPSLVCGWQVWLIAFVGVTGYCEMNVRAPEVPASEGDPVLGKGEFITYLPLYVAHSHPLLEPPITRSWPRELTTLAALAAKATSSASKRHSCVPARTATG